MAVDLSQMLSPKECPPPLQAWANSRIGENWGTARRKPRIIAGWRWDGISDEIEVVLAPTGTRSTNIPSEVWLAMERCA